MTQKTVSKQKNNELRAIRAFSDAFGVSQTQVKALVGRARGHGREQQDDDFEPFLRARTRFVPQRAGKSAKQKAFVSWLRETAEERHERKRVNRALAKAIRDHKFASAKDAMVAVRKHTSGGEGWLRLVENAYGRTQKKRAKVSEFSFDTNDDDYY